MDTADEIRQFEYEGRWSAAAAAWRKALASWSDGDSLPARCALVRCLWHDCRVQEAEDELAAALRDVHDETPTVVRGRLLLEQGRLQESRGNYRTAHARYAEARDLLSGVAHDSHEALLLLARLARETGDAPEAEAALAAIEQMQLPDLARAELLDERGALQISRGHFDAARITLINALESGKSVSEYRQAYTSLQLAEAHIGLGRLVDAEEALRGARAVFTEIADHRGLSEMYELLGRLYERRQDYTKAAKAYHDGLEHDYKSDDEVGQARAYRHLARCYRNLGEHSNADSLLEDAEAILPSEHDVEKAALWMEQGHLACDLTEYDEAIRRFRNAIELIAPDDDPGRLAQARRGLARALREASKLEEARQLLEETRDTWPTDGDKREYDDLLDDLAEVYLELDSYDPARNTLIESLRIGEDVGSPQSRARTHLLLSQALFALGERSDAQAHLTDALAIFDNPQTGIGNTSLRADALMQRGVVHAADGEIKSAVEAFALALKMSTRRGDVVRIARAQRELASCFRRRGDLDRADDYLDSAVDELRDVADRMEHELLTLERIRLDVAMRQFGDVERRLVSARGFFASRGSVVHAGECDRLLGRLFFESYRYDDALRALQAARDVFDKANAAHELDDTFDDIAEVYLELRQLGDAEVALDDSFNIDKTLKWRSGSGRTQLLRARLALLRNDVPKARQKASDAFGAYETDEIGLANAHLMLGDCAVREGKLETAIEEYKKARQLEKSSGDQVGAAGAYRRLGHVHLLSGEYQRAEEAFEHAAEHLDGLRVVRELAPLERDRGQLQIDWKNDHLAAVSYFERSLRYYRELDDNAGVTDIFQRLIAAHQARNEHDEAFRYMQELGLRHASMWTMLAKELDPSISDRVIALFNSKAYAAAVTEGFKVVEAELRRRAADANVGTVGGKPGAPADTTIPIQTVIKTWLAPHAGSMNVPRFAKDGDHEMFRDLCCASFEFIRNPVIHQSGEMTPQQAFTSLCLANLVMSLLKASA